MEKISTRPDGCWLWTAAIHDNGYGYFRLGGKSVRAHRWAYANFIDEIPEGAVLMHRCDVKACVNPWHLIPGTQLDNQRDMVEKGRVGDRGMHMKGRGALSHELADEIRSRYAKGAKQRDLADEFGVAQSMISLIVTGRRWVRSPA